MMHPPREPHSFAMARLEITCSWHGRHSLLIGGDASIVELAADLVKRRYDEYGFPTTVSMTDVDFTPPGAPDVEDWDC